MAYRDCDLGEIYPPFSHYAKDLNHSYPELAPLAQFLTGKYPPSTTCLTWSTSSNVDIIMVDVKPLPARPNIERILDIAMLEQYAVEVPADVALRLFLIEDVSADVVNMLGSGYGSYPHFFENHMHTIGFRLYGKIDMNGYPVPNKKESVSSAHKGKLLTPTEIVRLPYFSLPFRRMFEYSSDRARQIHRKQRTMFREYNVEGLSLEERVTGAIHSAENGVASIGERDSFLSSFAIWPIDVLRLISTTNQNEGIFLFDSIGSHHPGYKESSVKRGLFDTLPCFSTNSAIPCCISGSEHSLRKAFLQQFQYDNFINAVLEDNSILLWAVMKSTLGEWLESVDYFDMEASIDSEDVNFTDDNWMLCDLMDKHGLR
ncbi:MAG: hypothetical protein M1829_001492 [Trizodia sp. TS-e1964]|nr:MAG: hypothetical protein M1829_001492 [Trizodia sp. TS-e1964]